MYVLYYNVDSAVLSTFQPGPRDRGVTGITKEGTVLPIRGENFCHLTYGDGQPIIPQYSFVILTVNCVVLTALRLQEVLQY